MHSKAISQSNSKATILKHLETTGPTCAMKGMHTDATLAVNQIVFFFSRKKDIPEALRWVDTGISTQKVVRQLKNN